jgi:hypothetical protein
MKVSEVMNEMENIESASAQKVEAILRDTPKMVAVFEIIAGSKANPKFPHWIDMNDGERCYFPDISTVASITGKFRQYNSGSYYQKKDGSIFPFIRFVGYSDLKALTGGRPRWGQTVRGAGQTW